MKNTETVKLNLDNFLINDEIKLFRDTYIQYKIDAEKSSKDYIRSVLYTYDNILDFIRNLENDFFDFILPKLEKSITIIIRSGAYDLNTEIFIDKYYSKYCTFFDELNDIISLVNKIELDFIKEQHKISNVIENRPKLVGGGFGIRGAIKGIAIASLYNSISKSTHQLIASYGKKIDKNNYLNKLKSLLISEDFKSILTTAIYNSSISIFPAFLEAYEDILGKQYCKNYAIVSQKAERIIYNINADLIPEEDKQNLLFNLLMNEPYHKDIYYHLMKDNLEYIKQISSIANYFGLNIDSSKDIILKSEINKYQQKFSYEESIIIKERISNLYNDLDFIKTPESMKQFENKIDKIKKEFLTFDGVTYKTIEDKEVAINEKETLDNIITHIKEYKDNDYLIRTLKKFSNKKYIVPGLSKLEKEIEYQIYRNLVSNIDKDSIREIDLLLNSLPSNKLYDHSKRCISNLKKRIKTLNENKEKKQKELEQQKIELKEQEKREKEKQIDEQKENELKNIINDIDNNFKNSSKFFLSEELDYDKQEEILEYLKLPLYDTIILFFKEKSISFKVLLLTEDYIYTNIEGKIKVYYENIIKINVKKRKYLEIFTISDNKKKHIKLSLKTSDNELEFLSDSIEKLTYLKKKY